MKQSPRNRTSRADHNGSTDLHNYGHYNRFQAPDPASTRGFRSFWLAGAMALATGLTACSTTPEPAEPASEPVRAEQPRPEPKPVEVAERAPEKYVVKKGDTLWDISTMFLKDPWLWPEIWYTNPQIANPHLIYPGDIITLFWYDGQPQMRITRDGEIYQTTLPTERLSPKVRTMPLEEAIQTIPIDVIHAFLTAPGVITEDEYEELPYIMRSLDGRIMMGERDKVYVRGLDEPEGRYRVIRLGDEYEDPVTGENLGYEAREIAEGIVVRQGDPATLLLTGSEIEARKGDRLQPTVDSKPRVNFLPRAPESDIEGQIINVVDGVAQIGQYMIVTLNRGERDGLEEGYVLDIYQRGKDVDDEVGGGSVRLPDQMAGTLMVFRVDERVSYGLVMHANSEIHLLDIVRNP